MKYIVILAAALALALPTMSVAQPQDHPQRGQEKAAPPQAGRGRPQAHAPANHAAPAAAAHNPRTQATRNNRGRGNNARPARPARPAGNHMFTFRGQTHSAMRAPAFRYPAGYRYRRWSSGQRLPLLFLSAPYFFNDFAGLGLETPPPGYRWVRYGPDALLVNVRTREVEDVAYGVFY